MGFDQPNTVVIQAHGMVAATSSNVIVQLDFTKVCSFQFIPGGRICVTFLDQAYRDEILWAGSITVDHHELIVTESDTPLISVYIHYLPVEAGEDGIKLALSPFGKVVDLSHQRFSSFRNISTGTRIVRMSHDQHLPLKLSIMGYPCRAWKRGQPLKCVICWGGGGAQSG